MVHIREACEHNLRGVDLRLPTQALVVLVGPSGSGKSSLAFDTLHAESRRRYLQALGLSSQAGRRPDVSSIEGLPPTVALPQLGPAPSARATVGSATGVRARLAMLFARAGTPHCPECDRPVVATDHDSIVQWALEQGDGARVHVEAPLRLRGGDVAAVLEEVSRQGFSRVRVAGDVVRVEDVEPSEVDGEVWVVVDRIKLRPDRRDRLHEAVRVAAMAGGGVLCLDLDGERTVFADRPFCLHCDRELAPLAPGSFSFDGRGACQACGGSGELDGSTCTRCEGCRLGPESRAVRWRGERFADWTGRSLSGVDASLTEPGTPVEAAVIEPLRQELTRLIELGLGPTLCHTRCAALSAGIWQRVRIAKHLIGGLSGVLYVLDEPTAQLDAQGVQQVLARLAGLVSEGNTVLVVSHRRALIEAADHLVEFGPGGGTSGGLVVAQGSAQDLVRAGTATGRWLQGALPMRDSLGLANTPVEIAGHSLPVRGLAVLHGPTGSGKSAVLDAAEAWARDKDWRVLRPGAARAGRGRSIPATFVGLWDTMRELLAATMEARVRGLTSASFSLNARGGRCEPCRGAGQRWINLGDLADVVDVCPVCQGRRFQRDVLEVRWKGHNAHELLELDASAAHALLAGHPKLERATRALRSVGLGYVRLGQPSDSLSGGEAMRLRLAKQLARARGMADTLLLLDAPTVGLHPIDVAEQVGLLHRLIEEGATIWVASDDPQLAAAADTVVDLA